MKKSTGSVFTLYTQDKVPEIPANQRLCVTCLEPMLFHYAWKSSERVVHYFYVCHCGSRSKGRLIHRKLNKKGELSS